MGAAFAAALWKFVTILTGLGMALVIATDRSNRTMGQGGFSVCVAIYILVYIVPALPWSDRQLVDVLPGDVVPSLQISFLVVYSLMERIFLRRVRDAGWNTKLAYLFILPMINFIPCILLLFWSTVGAPNESDGR